MDWADYLPVASGKIMDGRMDIRRITMADVFAALTSIIVVYFINRSRTEWRVQFQKFSETICMYAKS